jgi:serine/threonine protein kinase
LEQEDTLDEERAKFYAAEIVCGLEYLHSRGIIYRDLKPENIMISHHGHVVLTDFGLSKTGLVQKDARTKTRCGTPYYVAPEIILGEEYTKAVDFWSLGVVLYEMLFGVPPFYSEEAIGIYKKIVMNDYTIDSDLISEECQNFIELLLAEDPKQRLTEADDIKRHPFFAEYDWEKLKRQELTPPFIPKVYGPDDTQFFDSDVLSSPIEHDDTEVSEYSDWTISMNHSEVTTSYHHEAHNNNHGNGHNTDNNSHAKTPHKQLSHRGEYARSAIQIATPPAVTHVPPTSASVQTISPVINKLFTLRTGSNAASSTSETTAPSDSVGSVTEETVEKSEDVSSQ